MPVLCEHGLTRRRCKDCCRSSLCEHRNFKWECKPCGGSVYCVHDRKKSRCKDCGGSSICIHNKMKSRCKPCKGKSICPHNRIKSQCRECGGSSFCVHAKRKSRCSTCQLIKAVASEPSSSTVQMSADDNTYDIAEIAFDECYGVKLNVLEVVTIWLSHALKRETESLYTRLVVFNI